MDDDKKHVPAAHWARIGRAIESRLAVAPERYGEPLAGSLRAYRKLRVGDYRVVFEIAATDVLILAIIHRREVYDRVARRVR